MKYLNLWLWMWNLSTRLYFFVSNWSPFKFNVSVCSCSVRYEPKESFGYFSLNVKKIKFVTILTFALFDLLRNWQRYQVSKFILNRMKISKVRFLADINFDVWYWSAISINSSKPIIRYLWKSEIRVHFVESYHFNHTYFYHYKLLNHQESWFVLEKFRILNRIENLYILR